MPNALSGEDDIIPLLPTESYVLQVTPRNEIQPADEFVRTATTAMFHGADGTTAAVTRSTTGYSCV